VDEGAAIDQLRDARLTRVEQRDGLEDQAPGVPVAGVELGPPLPQLLDLCLEIRHVAGGYKGSRR
jgi:hypothetical protein